MSTNSSPPTRRSVLKIAAAGGALGLITSASSSIVNPARCERDPPLPHAGFGALAGKPAMAPVARPAAGSFGVSYAHLISVMERILR